MTNNHVIDGAQNGDISIILDPSLDDFEIKGDAIEVLAKDQLGDLAVLKVDLGDIKVEAIEWADSDQLEIGEWVLALGNPLELRNSVTQGIISAKHREIYKSAIEDLIQTTASINPGNSGGPLVNLDGKVVGINNAIATRTGLWQGVAFAIPSNYARGIAEQVIEKGKISWGYLGIGMGDLDEGLAKYFGLENTEGIIIRNVQPGTGADKAGLKAYDIVTKVNGVTVKDSRDMLRAIAMKPVGTDVQLDVLREAKEGSGKLEPMSVTATLGERPSEQELVSLLGGTRTPPPAQKAGVDDYGVEFDLTASETTEGLVIKSVAPGGLAEKAGLQAGDVVIQVNRQNVESVDDFKAALEKKQEDKDHLVMYMRGGTNNFTTMAAPEK